MKSWSEMTHDERAQYNYLGQQIEELERQLAEVKKESQAEIATLKAVIENDSENETAARKAAIAWDRSAHQTKENILSELHELVGLCGHCGKRSCAGRKSSSFLPANIPYESVIEAINKSPEHRNFYRCFQC